MNDSNIGIFSARVKMTSEFWVLLVLLNPLFWLMNDTMSARILYNKLSPIAFGGGGKRCVFSEWSLASNAEPSGSPTEDIKNKVICIEL